MTGGCPWRNLSPQGGRQRMDTRRGNGALGPIVALRGDSGCLLSAPSALLAPSTICFANAGEHSFLLPGQKLTRLQQFDGKSSVPRIPGWGNGESLGVSLTFPQCCFPERCMQGSCRRCGLVSASHRGVICWEFREWIPPGSSPPGHRGVSGQALGSWSPSPGSHPPCAINNPP